MNTEAPAWDAGDPAGSLARFAAWLNEQARATFLQDGTHIELFFLYRTDGQGAITQRPIFGRRRDYVVADQLSRAGADAGDQRRRDERV